MKILYLSHRLPYPPNKGEKIRTFNQIRQLARKHAIHLCSFADDLGELAQTANLKEYCVSVDAVYRNSVAAMALAPAAMLRNKPLSVQLFCRKALADLVRRKLATERFDCVLVSCSSMAQYVLGTSNISTIIDFIDVDSEKWREYAQRASFPLSTLYQREAELLAKYEEKLTLTFDHSILSTEAEAQVLRKRVKDSRVTVISNGVDLQYFSSLAIASPVNDRPIIVFTGVMDYFPNVDAVQYFCQEMFPLILDELPAAEFYIVGRNPTREVSRLGKHPSVVVTGTVPDVRPYLAQATVAVAPFRVARGVQNKVLEAMAMGVPVVGTTEAFKGIAVTDRDGIRIANDARPFAQHVMTFLQVDATLRRQHARQARAYVERHHRWEDQGAKLEQLLDDIVWANIAKKSPEMKNAV